MMKKSKEKIENSQGPSLRKLSIAMVCDPIGSNKSGVVVSSLRFGKLLQERGHHVIFIAAKSKEHRGHSQHGDIKAYRFRSLPVPRSNGWNLAFPTVGELKKVFQAEKIDVVHLLLPMSGAIVAIRAAKALNIKMVAHSHSQPENLFMDMPRLFQPILSNLWNKYLAWVYSKAELIIYPTEFGRRILHHLTEKDKNFAVVSNGVNLERYKTAALAASILGLDSQDGDIFRRAPGFLAVAPDFVARGWRSQVG